jgi:hypothetical protein
MSNANCLDGSGVCYPNDPFDCTEATAMKRRSFLVGLFCSLVLVAAAHADQGDSTTYHLRYNFSPGEVFRTKVIHLVSVETTIQGVTETAKTRSVSTKAWKIEQVANDGRTTFHYVVESVSMWHQMSGRQEVRYDSTKDEQPPPEYQHVAGSIGEPMATVTIAPNGEIVQRENARPQFNPGIGELTVALPKEPVAVGHQWSTEGEISLRARPSDPIKRVKLRQQYTLEKVQTGVATINVTSQVLTPLSDPALQSQLVQRIKKGHIKFDVDAGRILSQQMDSDEMVIGFNGPDSNMKYLSRLTEEAVREENVARTPAAPVRQ